jgi:pyridoxal/pyridoxine/pyridoxamine kinase
MQRIGVNVWPLNIVQFSNHTQYGQWAGEVLAPAQTELEHCVAQAFRHGSRRNPDFPSDFLRGQS